MCLLAKEKGSWLVLKACHGLYDPNKCWHQNSIEAWFIWMNFMKEPNKIYRRLDRALLSKQTSSFDSFGCWLVHVVGIMA